MPFKATLDQDDLSNYGCLPVEKQRGALPVGGVDPEEECPHLPLPGELLGGAGPLREVAHQQRGLLHGVPLAILHHHVVPVIAGRGVKILSSFLPNYITPKTYIHFNSCENLRKIL